MTWTAPEVKRPQIVLIATEDEHLRNLLDFHRLTLLHKCAGLDGHQLAAAPLGFTNLSLLGLVRHLSKVERVWFRSLFRERTIELPAADFDGVDPDGAREDYEAYLSEVELARESVRDAELDATFTFPDQDVATLRYVYLQVITEYARHNGHADLLRQAIDGATGV